MTDRPYDRERLKNLLHYVIWAVGTRAHFGATKLYKVAWFSEARHYVLTGRSITGSVYIREKYGPIPREGMIARDELEREGRIEQWQAPIYNHIGWRFRSIENPSPDAFDKFERDILDYWAKHIDGEHTAESISEESHDYGWEIAAMHEQLPFAAFLASRIRDPDSQEKVRHIEKAKELGLM